MLAAAVLAALALPAGAQIYDRRARLPPQQNFFNPFSIFTPMFQPPPQPEYREQREPRMRQTVRPRAPAPVVVIDSSKAPPPRKSDTTPSQTVVVMGATLADWLAYGLEDALADRPEIGVVRKIHPNSGLIRFDGHGNTDWAQAIRDILKDQKADFVVMLIGLDDRQPIRPKTAATDAAPGQRRTVASYEFRTDEWAAAYSERIDQAIAALKSKGVPVIWVGLPPIRGTRSTADMIYLNDLFRARAEHAGIVYVDVWDGFVDESGRFATYGPDVEGQERRLRSADGVHFTKAGAGKLAHYVEREINRLIGTKLPQVAMPSPANDTPTAPAGTAGAPGAPPERPVAGPVVPLTGTGSADALAGADRRSGLADPVAQRVLVKGEAVVGPRGRADNFFVTPEAAAAAAKAAASSASSIPIVASAPAAAAKSAPETAAQDSTPPSGSDRRNPPRVRTKQ